MADEELSPQEILVRYLDQKFYRLCSCMECNCLFLNKETYQVLWVSWKLEMEGECIYPSLNVFISLLFAAASWSDEG